MIHTLHGELAIYDTVSDKEIDNVCILISEMIEVKEGRAICVIFNIGDVDFIINDLCVNYKAI